ncbi:MAG: hypothetical protein ACRD4G_00875, partial [Bryobacteraceae bacterium]
QARILDVLPACASPGRAPWHIRVPRLHCIQANNFTHKFCGRTGFRDLKLPLAYVRAGGFFENFLYGLQVAQGGTLPVYYNPTDRKSTMVATSDIGAEVATLLSGPAWSGHRVIELGSMVSADEVATQLGDVLKVDVKAFAIPRAGWPAAFEQVGIPKGQTGPAEAMFDAVNSGWMNLGVEGTEHVPGTTSAHDVFAAAQKDATA